MLKYEDIIKTLNELKENIKKNELLYSKLLEFEKNFIFNNYVPEIKNNKIEEFIDDSIKTYEYKHPIVFSGNNNNCLIQIYGNQYENQYNGKVNYIDIKKEINTKNIKNVIGLKNYENIKLYFDEEYKKQIVNYDTDLEKYIYNGKNVDQYKPIEKQTICATIYTNYDMIIEIKLLNMKGNAKINTFAMGVMSSDIDLYDNILYGDEKNFNLNQCIETKQGIQNNILEIKYINMSINEEIKFESLNGTIKIEEKKIEKFMEKIEKKIHPKIIINYMNTRKIEEINYFFNQIDSYTKLTNEIIIEEKNEKIKFLVNRIKEIEEDKEKIKNKIINVEELDINIKKEIEEKKEEINKLNKENKLMKKKYENLEKIYNEILEKEIMNEKEDY